jgi:hypothetical protein
MTRRIFVMAFGLSLVAILTGGLAAVAAGAQRFPYATTVNSGDRIIAQMIFGNAAAGTVPGRDAIPVFTDVRAYDLFYQVDDDQSASDADAVRIYRSLHANGRADYLVVGKRVSVLAVLSDPEDTHYKICRVSYDAKTRLVLCNALADFP